MSQESQKDHTIALTKVRHDKEKEESKEEAAAAAAIMKSRDFMEPKEQSLAKSDPTTNNENKTTPAQEEDVMDYGENDDTDAVVDNNNNNNIHNSNQISKSRRRTSEMLLLEEIAAGPPTCMDCISAACPRIFAICVYIILPLWFLIFLSVGGGYWLASYEAPHEIQANDEVLKSQHMAETLDDSGTLILESLFELPTTCFEKYLQQQNITNTNATLLSIIVEQNNLQPTNIPTISLLEATSQTLLEILQSLAECSTEEAIGSDRLAVLHRAIRGDDNTTATTAGGGGGDLTFNWIRCWNQTELGSSHPLRVTDAHLEAAANQANFYAQVWEDDLERLTQQYIHEIIIPNTNNTTTTVEDIAQARQRAVNDASGGEFCIKNSAGTSWFWFTVMTTVGYGNQAPVTRGGRSMVSSFGFLSILAFGGILINAGHVVAVLIDDALRRKKLKPSPLTAVLFWAAVTTGWIFVIANITRRWWNDRVEDFEYTWWDSIWFAYISTTTIGLGDFFLQPEVIFLPDVAAFSLLFLTGFVFLSTFLDKLTQFFGRIFPNVAEDLRYRLGKSSLFYNDISVELAEDSRTVQALQELVDSLNANPRENDNKSLSVLQKENELLKSLLEHNARAVKRMLSQNDKERKGLEAEEQRVGDYINYADNIIPHREDIPTND